jgi:hypothetical protein
MRFSPFWLKINMPDSILIVGREKDDVVESSRFVSIDVGELLDI